MSKQLDWDVFRYVLEDPSLDLQAFEERMLHDESLAWAVADAVESIERLRTASRFVDLDALKAAYQADQQVSASAAASSAAASPTSTGSAGWHWSSLAALAAGLLLMIAGSAYSLLRLSADSQQRSADSLALRTTTLPTQTLAERWLALNASTELNLPAGGDELSMSLPGDDSSSQWGASDSSQASLEMGSESTPDDQDWMIEAASLFYNQGAAS